MTVTVWLILQSVLLLAVIVLFFRSQSGRDPSGKALADEMEKSRSLLRDELAKSRDDSSANARQLREEVGNSSRNFSDMVARQVRDLGEMQQHQLSGFAAQLAELTKANEARMDRLRDTVEQRLALIQEDNTRKLDQMRATVDEKLHETLEKRLGDSFKIVSDRLEMVRQGLGEMQALATDVGGLKKILTNIKTRGTWGETQLGNLLDEIFAPDQYGTNVATRPGSRDHVEFAIKLPGKDDGVVWLPVDAKFPREDYERLIEAQEQANPVLVEELGKMLEARIRQEAKDIRDKYIDPPHTTDFGILYLPTEGLYAEVIRRPGLFDAVRREYRVAITGPTTVLAFLNSLQMGFRTLAIEKRASEVWNLLSAVKTEFNKFGIILDRANKQLETVSNTIGTAAAKTRRIEQKLRNVQGLSAAESSAVLEVPDADQDEAVNDG
jgi:DNA recombination protein RmuC